MTLAEEFEKIGRIYEVLGELRDLADECAVAPLRVSELRNALRTVEHVAKEHYMAADIWMTQPLAEAFPDGQAAPATLTPRQVMYLAALAYGGRQSRESVGLPASRSCSEPRSDGEKCCQYSLLFTERAVCGSHATAAERERNRKLKEAWNLEHPDYQL